MSNIEGPNSPENSANDSNEKLTFSRGEILKALATIPVFGFFAVEFARKLSFTRSKKTDILTELGLRHQAPTVLPKTTMQPAGELVRIGLVGFGARGEYLARALGFAHPDWMNVNKDNAELQDRLQQDDLNVAITGICDVFDMRAERGLETTRNKIWASNTDKLPETRRYHNYREMVASRDIDAVIVTTPDFQHAPVSIAALNEGKHVYCEKCMTRTEREVNQVDAAVRAAEKKHSVAFQVGHQYYQNEVFHRAKEILDKDVLGKVTLVKTSSNRNTQWGAWIRHLDENGNPKPGNPKSIDWEEWLGGAPKVPFSLDRYYNWTKYWDYATGISGQLFSHEYDAVNQLLGLGMPKSCVSSGGIYYYRDGREIPDIFNATFEFPDHELTLLYSASLASSRTQGRILLGHDAWMEVGNSLNVYPDGRSTRYQEKINEGLIDISRPLVSFQQGARQIDAITSATEKYYADRGLIYTYAGQRRVDVTHLHLLEWLNGIRNNGKLSCPIDKGIEVTIACHMATASYREKRRVEWDPVRRKIV
jgi:predicted dehydrogenase